MSGITTRKSYTKIKNFTEKDQVRVKYSYIGKDKKLMLSVYIGEDVYNDLTKGQTFKRLKVEYIPNDMVIITPTNEEKEGIIHRYNGKGMFKTTCIRLSLSSYKTLKLRKKDFNNRVVEYTINNHRLNVDLIGDKRKKITPTDPIKVHKEFAHRSFIESIKPIEISAPDYQDMPSRVYKEDMDSMIVTHHYLNDVRDSIENRLLDMEERFEKRILEFEDYFIKKLDRLDNKIMDNFKINKLEEDVKAIENLLKEFMDQPLRPLKTDKGNSLDIDTLKQLLGKANDEMNIRFSKVEREIVNLVSKSVDINARLNLLLQNVESKTDISLDFMEIKNILNDIKKSHRDKSLFEKILGKD